MTFLTLGFVGSSPTLKTKISCVLLIQKILHIYGTVKVAFVKVLLKKLNTFNLNN